ncbi:hypothetical protein CTA2_6796 [Colletotrichum tanaceti]|nr:hypothetical protein CTA2_6796 [Colletotrichum tanaceti]
MAPALATLMARTSLMVPNPPAAPYTEPYLTANLVCRVALALLANAVCCVPLGNLYRQGELAPVVLIGTVVAANCLTVVNALVWHNDNVYEWWDGQLWCDLHAYLYQPLMPLYWLSVLAITRNLAHQMGLSRAGPLSRRERRRKTLVEALIVFPLPILQMGLLYPISSQRYRIVTLTGCMWTAHPSWPFFVFFLLPRPLVVLMSSYYAGDRTRWRLFLVTACVLVPYMPLELYMTAAQFRTDMLSRGFDFRRIRQQVDDPFPWDTILLLPSGSLGFLELNHQYLAIATALPVFYFFGMTTDTTKTYRRAMRALGFGRVFPRLREGFAASGHAEQRPEAPWQEQVVLTLMKSAGDDDSQTSPCDPEGIIKPSSDRHHGHSQGSSNASDSLWPHDRAILDGQSAITLPAKAHVYARSE